MSFELILLPGMHGGTGHFRQLEAALGKKVPVTALPLPRRARWGLDGYKDWLAAQLDGRGPRVVVAESFSGLFALKLCMEKPEALRGLVLLGGFTRLPAWMRLAAACMPPLPLGSPPFFTLGKRLLLGSKRQLSVEESLRDELKAAGSLVLSSRIRAAGRANLRRAAGELKVPLLAISGSRDILAGPASRQFPWLPAAQCLEYDAPHLLSSFVPEAAAKAILRFTKPFIQGRGDLNSYELLKSTNAE